MNRISRDKLMLSKWTACQPENKEKHWLVTELLRDSDDAVTACRLEAVINKRCIDVPWRELKNSEKWRQGWK